jgi:apolipoprotein N-acyltransferase
VRVHVTTNSWAALALGIASALLLAAATEPFALSWLAWIAPLPTFIVLARPEVRRRTAFAAGFAYGFTALLTIATWFLAFTWIGYLCSAVYWGVMAGILFALAVTAARGLPALARPLVFPAGWVAIEWLRTQGMLNFPWGGLSVTQSKALPVLQVLDLVGAFGLSFLMALPASGLAFWFAHRRPLPTDPTDRIDRSEEAEPNPGKLWLAISLALIAAACARGEWLLRQAPPPSPTVRAGAVQASRSYKANGVEVVCLSDINDYLAGTGDAIQQGAEIVFWPESACTDDAIYSTGARERLQSLARQSKTHLLVGSFIEDRKSGKTTNGSAFYDDEGDLIGRYGKVLIVPFGEYLPLRPLLGMTPARDFLPEDLAPGEGFKALPWTKGKIGVSICYESAFGFISRRYVQQGANLLTVLTSDGWADRPSAGLQHAQFAPLRAVECRRSIVRAAATGRSEMIDPYGRVLQSQAMFTQGVLVQELPLRTDRTVYSYLGDWPVAMSWLILVWGIVGSFRRRRDEA